MQTDNLNDALKRCPAGLAAQILGVRSVNTVKAWHKAGKIKATRTPTGRYLYDMADYLRRTGRESEAGA